MSKHPSYESLILQILITKVDTENQTGKKNSQTSAEKQ